MRASLCVQWEVNEADRRPWLSLLPSYNGQYETFRSELDLRKSGMEEQGASGLVVGVDFKTIQIKKID